MIYFIFPLGFFVLPLSFGLAAPGTVWEEQLHLVAPINDFIRIRIVSALH